MAGRGGGDMGGCKAVREVRAGFWSPRTVGCEGRGELPGTLRLPHWRKPRSSPGDGLRRDGLETPTWTYPESAQARGWGGQVVSSGPLLSGKLSGTHGEAGLVQSEVIRACWDRLSLNKISKEQKILSMNSTSFRSV